MLPAKDEGELLGGRRAFAIDGDARFGNAEVYLERLLERPRHVEFQVLGDRHGDAVHLFERDCSMQRRNQKVIEEAPGPAPIAPVTEVARPDRAHHRNGLRQHRHVEMLRGADGSFNFLEMNTRLQVEHGVTEEITGVDLVQAQIRSAAGKGSSDICRRRSSGHAIQARRRTPKTRRTSSRRPAS